MVAAGRPCLFAEETAIGPVSLSTSSATGCIGIRTATVPVLSPRSQFRLGACATTMVRAPGQNASIRSRASCGNVSTRPSRVRREPISTGGGTLRPRPFASSSALTAYGVKASAPMP